MDHRARVFISCGQNRSTDELQAAQSVAAALASEGFAPYIAVEQQTLSGVRENVFNVLRDAEYYVFIDFKREELAAHSPTTSYRGSLFSHQELAIASFLDKDVVAFQEDGVLPLDGLMKFIQANCRGFSERASLPDLVTSEARSRGWATTAYNGLRFEIAEPPYMDLAIADDPRGRHGRFFHLRVVNGHPSRAALNCYAYVHRVARLPGRSPEVYETAELMWAGYPLPNVVIAPASSRLLAAFFVVHEDPTRPHFQVLTISDRFRPQLHGPGQWEVTYRVLSETVPGATGTYRLDLGASLEEVRLLQPDTGTVEQADATDGASHRR